jgi:hypothetical protein
LPKEFKVGAVSLVIPKLGFTEPLHIVDIINSSLGDRQCPGTRSAGAGRPFPVAADWGTDFCVPSLRFAPWLGAGLDGYEDVTVFDPL